MNESEAVGGASPLTNNPPTLRRLPLLRLGSLLPWRRRKERRWRRTKEM